MDIQNSEDVKLPEEIQKKIEIVRNNLTLAEQETIRLNELKRMQETDIKENLTKLENLKEEIAYLEEVKVSVQAENQAARDKTAESQRRLQQNTLEADKMAETVVEKNEELAQRESEIKNKEISIATQIKKNQEKEIEMNRIIAEAKSQIEEIKAFAEKLC